MDITRFLLSLLTISGVIFPNISVANVDIGRMNISEAAKLLESSVTPPSQITLIFEGEEYQIESKNIDLEYDYTSSAIRAYEMVKTGNIFYDTKLKTDILFKPKNLGLIANYNKDKLDSSVSVISGLVSIDPVYPSLIIQNKNVVIKQGSKGSILDKDFLYSEISKNIAFAKSDKINLKTNEVDPTLTQSETEDLKNKANSLIGKKLEIKSGYDSITKQDKDLIKLLDPRNKFNELEMNKLTSEVSAKFNREPQNAKFEFLPDSNSTGGKVNEFLPAMDGIVVDREKLATLIIESIEGQIFTIEAPVSKTSPTITTDKVNNLGIKELIGRGTSTYYHSIPGRVHNVSLAASRINGTLVAPGETFSFNNTLGDVSKFTGYQSAYVILSGKTVLGDGGGVCQVSSTLFRAVLNAGLQIDTRTAHAYRVGYYEQGSPPGLDATVYSPSPDFKFTNDTDNHILVSAKADSKNYSLVFELYGTNDGRTAEISKPVISSQTAPPPDIYQDDPTLPTGVVKQVEYKAFGAKVNFNYLVTKNGEVLHKKTFTSNYRPWAAVYLKGTGPAVN